MFANVVVLLAENPHDLHWMLYWLYDELKAWIKKKRSCVWLGKESEQFIIGLYINNPQLRQLKEYVYLTGIVTKDRKMDGKVESRVLSFECPLKEQHGYI